MAGAEKIFQEKFTGTITERPEFQKLLRALKTGDTLIVTKLDRFARNTREALAIIQELFKENVKVNILNMGLIDNTPTGQLVFTIFSAFAQFERDMIVTRTQVLFCIADSSTSFSLLIIKVALHEIKVKHL